MKQIIFISTLLLAASGIYGFIDYRVQSAKGSLDGLYQDEVYNAKPGPVKAVGQDKGEVKVAEVKEERPLDIEDFSRKAFTPSEIIEDEMVLEAKPPSKKAAAKTVADDEKTDSSVLEVGVQLVPAKTVVTTKPEPYAIEEIQVLTAVVKDSVAAAAPEAGEKKFIKLSSFSRAPIRKTTSKAHPRLHQATPPPSSGNTEVDTTVFDKGAAVQQ